MDFRKSGERFAPYVMIGIAITIGVGLFILFFYVALWGLLIGGILWMVMFIKNYFFVKQVPKKKEGRVIEHDDKL